MNRIDLQALFDNACIGLTDLVFARTIQRLGFCEDPWVGLAAALVSRASSEGHVCLDLDVAVQQALPDLPFASPDFVAPEPMAWCERLRACAAVGAPGDFRPLILTSRRLYLHRYWCCEKDLAEAILARCTHPDLRDQDDPVMSDLLGRLFIDTTGAQARATRLAAMRRFSVISGGPGTGKTYTVGKIISLLQALCPDRPLTIFLAAPTGKAAARLQASVENYFESAGGKQAAASVLDAQTLHRLLGYMPAAGRFRYGANHSLPADAVIVDEASMIDLVMMRQLVQAVPAHARLILVGDKDQLASVEAGAVMGDICHGINRSDARTPAPPVDAAVAQADAGILARHIVVLNRSYRFDTGSGIGALARAVNAGDAQQVLALLADERETAVTLNPISGWVSNADRLNGDILAGFGALFRCRDSQAAFDHLNRFRILCAVRQGPYGIMALNRRVEQVLRHNDPLGMPVPGQTEWYHGRPVMITRNDYHQTLYNGDVGIVWGGRQGAYIDVQVVFPGSDGGFKYLRTQQLPEHQTVYAMTIHKSQGSEFEHVMIVLPDEDVPLLTRELIYTAVTRARRSVTIWAHPDLLVKAIQRPIQRASGLRNALWP